MTERSLRSGLTLRVLAVALLLLGALLFVRFAVDRGLRPLTVVSAAIEARGHELLTPVSEAGLPREARILVNHINDLLGRLGHTISAQRRFVADAAHARTLTALDLAALARCVGENWIGPALAGHMDFGFIAPPRPVIILGHAGLLEELINNLIDNALRYCPEGSSVTLSVSADPLPELAVSDDGPGIVENERELIFERFHRGDSVTAEGCGLGLAIVRESATL